MRIAAVAARTKDDVTESDVEWLPLWLTFISLRTAGTRPRISKPHVGWRQRQTKGSSLFDRCISLNRVAFNCFRVTAERVSLIIKFKFSAQYLHWKRAHLNTWQKTHTHMWNTVKHIIASASACRVDTYRTWWSTIKVTLKSETDEETNEAQIEWGNRKMRSECERTLNNRNKCISLQCPCVSIVIFYVR
jgi:hypothetical protein